MEIKEFVEKIADLFDNADQAIFKPETKFREVPEYSSLVALSIIAMIDEECGVLLGAKEMKAAETIADLFKIVSDKE